MTKARDIADRKLDGENLEFGDNDKAIFGAGSDLQIYHDGSNSYVQDAGTGNLIIKGTDLRLRGNNDHNYLVAQEGAETALYHNNALKFNTTATGVDVTGTVVSDGLTVAGNVSVDGGTIKLDGNYPVGSNNVALGNNSLNGSMTGAGNIALGQNALNSATTSGYAVAIGEDALKTQTSGLYNVAIGRHALRLSETSSENVAIGGLSMDAHTTGGSNVAVGYLSLSASTTASFNTAVGKSAGTSLTTGTVNTFVGFGSGNEMTTGSKNVILGSYDGNGGGLDIRTNTNNIVLSDGDGNPRLSITNTGQVNIGGLFTRTGTSLAVYENGRGWAAKFERPNNGNLIEFLNTASGVAGSITVSGATASYNTSSDYRLKENVVELTGATDRLKQIPVHRFNFTVDPDTTVDGFLAHEVQAIVPEAITGTKDEVDADGNPVYQGIDQSKLVPLLVATIKELEARIAALESA